jgi:hypothetical protein
MRQVGCGQVEQGGAGTGGDGSVRDGSGGDGLCGDGSGGDGSGGERSGGNGSAGTGRERMGWDGSGKNGSVGDGSVGNGLVAKKVAADPPSFNWFLLKSLSLIFFVWLFFMAETLVNHHIDFIAIDEAHVVASWGQDFRPCFRKIKELKTFIGRHVKTVALTATATVQCQKDIKVIFPYYEWNYFTLCG